MDLKLEIPVNHRPLKLRAFFKSFEGRDSDGPSRYVSTTKWVSEGEFRALVDSGHVVRAIPRAPMVPLLSASGGGKLLMLHQPVGAAADSVPVNERMITVSDWGYALAISHAHTHDLLLV